MADGPGDPLTLIAGRLPHLSPSAAGAVARHLVDEDHWARVAPRPGPEGTLLPGTQCPVCQHRPLRSVPIGPAGGVVLCRNGCLCAGDGCGCGMPVVVAAGVVHVWAMSALAV